MRWRHVLLLTAALLTACADNPRAPIEDRSGGRYSTGKHVHVSPVRGKPYTVRPGDTLSSIAFELGITFKELAAINGIKPPYAIYAGQELRTVRAKPVAESPTANVPRSIKVRRGDSLYALAKRYGLDASELARINGLKPPYTIHVGQVLRTTTPPPSPSPQGKAGKAPVNTATTTGKKTSPKVTQSSSSQVTKGTVTLGPVARWRWPANGKVIRNYSTNLHKGIDIAGQRGEGVKAVAPGVVVYSGTGVKGYGALIIVKHNEDYLSAYGHNDAILVLEGARVKEGQVIARMGSSGTDTVKLHFEIRRQGKPVDPLKVLPRR